MMNLNEQESKHHVAWADRVEYDKLWFRNIQRCDEDFGTDLYETSVWRLYYSIINIKDGPQLKDMIDTYLYDVWYPSIEEHIRLWRRDNLFEQDDPTVEESERQQYRRERLPLLCLYIRQLLNDNGYGFYRGRSEEVEDKMY